MNPTHRCRNEHNSNTVFNLPPQARGKKSSLAPGKVRMKFVALLLLPLFPFVYGKSEEFPPVMAYGQVKSQLNPSQQEAVQAIIDNQELTKQQVQDQIGEEFEKIGSPAKDAYGAAIENINELRANATTDNDGEGVNMSSEARRLMEKESTILNNLAISFVEEDSELQELFKSTNKATMKEIEDAKARMHIEPAATTTSTTAAPNSMQYQNYQSYPQQQQQQQQQQPMNQYYQQQPYYPNYQNYPQQQQYWQNNQYRQG